MSSYLKTSNFMTLLFLALVAWHFLTVVGLLGAVPVTRAEVFVRLGIILGVTIVASFFSALFWQKQDREPMLPDEREIKIERISEGVGLMIIFIGLIALAWFVFAPLSAAGVVNFILGIVAVSELVKLLIVVYLHRFGVFA